MLINSKWLLKSFLISESTSCIVFKENGVFLANEDSSDIKAGEDGAIQQWKYEHDKLILSYNNGYSTYRGILISDRYTGKASNQDGFEWDFEAKLLFDRPSQEQLSLGKLAMDYQWLLKAFYDTALISPANDSTDRYLSLHADGSLEYLDSAQQPLPFEKKDSWVLLDDRLIVRVNWIDTQYVSYIFICQLGQIVGKAKNREGRVWYFKALPYRRIGDFDELFPENEGIFQGINTIPGKIHSIGEYHKYWLIRNVLHNPDCDRYSKDILSLKEKQDWAVQKFYDLVAPLISSGEVCLCYVPSSTNDKLDTGIRQLASKLASHAQRTDATACIVRTKTIQKAAYGGERSRDIQLGSLVIEQVELIKGKDVILLDDVTTTGTSLEVCRDLLIVAGAKTVYCLALGQTV